MNLIVVINAAPPVAMSMNVLAITLYTTAPAPRMFRGGCGLWGLSTDGRGRLGRTILAAAGGCLPPNPGRRADLLLVHWGVPQERASQGAELCAAPGEQAPSIGGT